MSVRTLLIVLLPSLLVACSTAYQRPPLKLNAQWTAQTAQNAQLPLNADQWWHEFRDPTLFQLIQTARRQNADVRSAEINLRKAAIGIDLADSVVRPSPSLSSAFGASKDLSSGSSELQQSASLSFGVSYELDFWGRLRAGQHTAQANYLSAQADYQAVRILQETSVATQYWQLTELMARDKVLRDSLERKIQIEQLVQSRFSVGYVSQEDVDNAQKNTTQTHNELEDLQFELQTRRTALGQLLDVPPGAVTISVSPFSVDMPLPQIHAGLPSSLLTRRPDLISAEQRLRAALIQVDVAKISFLPSFSLSGSAGSSSKELSTLLSSPASATLGLGIGIPLNFFEIKSRVKSEELSYETAIIAYQKAVLGVLAEVDDALTQRQRLAIEWQRLLQQQKLLQKQEELAQFRYEEGLTDIQPWLDSIEARQQLELSLVSKRVAQLSNLALLYKVLGGAPVVTPD